MTTTTPCPFCNAAVGEPCITRTGRPAIRPHKGRVALAADAKAAPEAEDAPRIVEAVQAAETTPEAPIAILEPVAAPVRVVSHPSRRRRIAGGVRSMLAAGRYAEAGAVFCVALVAIAFGGGL